MHKIAIEFDKFSIEALLDNSPTAKQIWAQLPIEARTNTWGDEIYFEIPVNMPQEPDARAQVDIGELGYWPVGRAFCIFFGPTPVSTDERPRAASPVNIIGNVISELSLLSSIQDGEQIIITQLD